MIDGALLLIVVYRLIVVMGIVQHCGQIKHVVLGCEGVSCMHFQNFVAKNIRLNYLIHKYIHKI